MVGNVVAYSFAHQKRHLGQNTLVPVLGLSGGQSLTMVAMYDCKEDVLCYIQPHKWFNSYTMKFSEEGLVMVSLSFPLPKEVGLRRYKKWSSRAVSQRWAVRALPGTTRYQALRVDFW